MIPFSSLCHAVWSNEVCRNISFMNQIFWSQTACAWYSYMTWVVLGCENLSLIVQTQSAKKK